MCAPPCALASSSGRASFALLLPFRGRAPPSRRLTETDGDRAISAIAFSPCLSSGSTRERAIRITPDRLCRTRAFAGMRTGRKGRTKATGSGHSRRSWRGALSVSCSHEGRRRSRGRGGSGGKPRGLRRRRIAAPISTSPGGRQGMGSRLVAGAMAICVVLLTSAPPAEASWSVEVDAGMPAAIGEGRARHAEARRRLPSVRRPARHDGPRPRRGFGAGDHLRFRRRAPGRSVSTNLRRRALALRRPGRRAHADADARRAFEPCARRGRRRRRGRDGSARLDGRDRRPVRGLSHRRPAGRTDARPPRAHGRFDLADGRHRPGEHRAPHRSRAAHGSSRRCAAEDQASGRGPRADRRHRRRLPRRGDDPERGSGIRGLHRRRRDGLARLALRRDLSGRAAVLAKAPPAR